MMKTTSLPNILYMNFPSDDTYWQETYQYVKDNSTDEDKILACTEFPAVLTNSYPYEWLYWNTPSQYNFLILHKGMKDRLKEKDLAFFKNNYTLAFENPVFQVFSKSNIEQQPKPSPSLSYALRAVAYPILKKVKHFLKNKADKSKKNILLVTANNSGNIGDDVITLAARDLLQKQYPEANIVIDKGPADREVIKKVNLVVLGGGGIFYDTCFYNVINYCQYVLYADEYGIPSCALGVGVARTLTGLGYEIYRNTLNRSKVFFVRDKFSYEKLTEGLKLDIPVFLKRDTAFSFSSDKKTKHQIKKGDKPLLFLSLIDTSKLVNKSFANYREAMPSVIDYLNKHFQIVFIVQSRDDMGLNKLYCEKYQLDYIDVPFSEAQSAVDLYRQADLVITGRLHGYILSQLAGVPCIPVSSKITKLSYMIGNFLPSMSSDIIAVKDFCLEDFVEKVTLFKKDPSHFIAKPEELNDCIESARSMGPELKAIIGKLK